MFTDNIKRSTGIDLPANPKIAGIFEEKKKPILAISVAFKHIYEPLIGKWIFQLKLAINHVCLTRVVHERWKS